MNNAQRLKSLRVRKPLLQEELARLVGMSVYEIGDLEQHADELLISVSFNQIFKIAAALEVSPEVLLTGGASHEQWTSPNDLAQALADFARDRNLSVSRLGESIGWELAPFFADPEGELLAAPPMFLQDLAACLSIPWETAIPRVSSRCSARSNDAA